MGKPVLMLRLEGPLQAWGVRSRWDVRDTQLEPTKSGVIGLLGCALGYPMHDARLETELDAGLRFGVRVENSGRVLEDYHTVTDFLPTAEGTYRHSGVKTSSSLERLRIDPDATPATIISPRFYLEDAAFLVALEETGRHPFLLQRCAEAVRHPFWPLFLGRKACVSSRPIFEELTERYDSLEDALQKHPWSWLGAEGKNRIPRRPQLTAYVEIENSAATPRDFLRQDAVRINPARQYGFRSVRRLNPIALEDLTEWKEVL
jgi:CRISPR system Cascade subunit CasD